LENFYKSVDEVLDKSYNLQWIDLSHNLLERLDYDFRNFPNLKILYLHCNLLGDLKEFQKLAEVDLEGLTVHGNPIDKIPYYKFYIIGLFYSCLKNLDSVVVSRKDREGCRNHVIARGNWEFPRAVLPLLPSKKKEEDSNVFE